MLAVLYGLSDGTAAGLHAVSVSVLNNNVTNADISRRAITTIKLTGFRQRKR